MISSYSMNKCQNTILYQKNKRMISCGEEANNQANIFNMTKRNPIKSRFKSMGEI